MSIRVMTKVFASSESQLAGRLVLLAVADAAHDDGIAWIGQEMIAEKAKVTGQTVRRCLRELEKAGEIQTRKAKRGRKRINVYRVMLAGLAEPDYDRLPFELENPFDDRTISAVASEHDDRTSEPTTTADPGLDSGGLSISGLNRKGPERANALPEHGPPKLRQIDGQDIAFNALRDVCGIAPNDRNRSKEVAVGLNGGGGGIEVGIRKLVWEELVESRFGGDVGEALEVVAGEPERFEQALAVMIERRAGQYREAMPGAILSPIPLAKWWLSLEHLTAARRDGGLTAAEMASFRG